VASAQLISLSMAYETEISHWRRRHLC